MKKNEHSGERVVVAMSGGADSSVAAALLVEQGYQVIGVMLRTWVGSLTGGLVTDTYERSLENAQNSARILKIPLQVVDVTSEFKAAVVDYYINSHSQGLTPNPCFICNRQIKWGLLLQDALKMGANRVASGHYARVIKSSDGKYQLYKAIDRNKDQSYVLASLNQSQLARAMFPLGEILKRKVIEIARSYNFTNKNYEESQDLCFLENQTQQEFLRRYAPDLFKPGEIRDTEGKLIGQHEGLALYTIGQRKGIRVSHTEPYYVTNKELATNTLIVGKKSHLGIQRIHVSGVNWISGVQPKLPETYQIKVRYRSAAVKAVIKTAHSSGYDIIFDEPVRDPTPGQYAVFYNDELVVGSGVISKTYAGEIR